MLRRTRPTPDAAYVRTLAGTIEPRSRPHAWRAWLAASATAVLLGGLGASGELGYAASAVGNGVQGLFGNGGTPVATTASSAENQYGAHPEPLGVALLGSRRLTVSRRGSVTLTLVCTHPSGCRYTLKILDSRGHVIGVTSVHIKKGKREKVTIKLNRLGRGELKGQRSKKLSAKVISLRGKQKATIGHVTLQQG